ncbi:MAG: hypothetical protein Q9171_006391 [Xanthocarpia ochracea]
MVLTLDSLGSLILLALVSLFAPSISTPTDTPISNNNPNWTIAVQKGTVLYAQLQSRCFPDRIKPMTVESLQADKWDFTVPWPPPAESLTIFPIFVARMFGWTISDKDYYVEDVGREGAESDPPSSAGSLGDRVSVRTEYNNLYSPRNGLVAAYSTQRVKNDQVHWSDVTFALWERLTSIVGTRVKDLHYIARTGIYNKFTVSIMEDAVPQGKNIAIFEPGDPAFLALLGTPNGVGAVYLLMQHKQALGFKTISRVVVVLDGPGHSLTPIIIYKVRDMPSIDKADPALGTRDPHDDAVVKATWWAVVGALAGISSAGSRAGLETCIYAGPSIGMGAEEEVRAQVREKVREHYANVRRMVPRERMLEYELRSG